MISTDNITQLQRPLKTTQIINTTRTTVNNYNDPLKLRRPSTITMTLKNSSDHKLNTTTTNLDNYNHPNQTNIGPKQYNDSRTLGSMKRSFI